MDVQMQKMAEIWQRWGEEGALRSRQERGWRHVALRPRREEMPHLRYLGRSQPLIMQQAGGEVGGGLIDLVCYAQDSPRRLARSLASPRPFCVTASLDRRCASVAKTGTSLHSFRSVAPQDRADHCCLILAWVARA